jgi:hypothetical protein
LTPQRRETLEEIYDSEVLGGATAHELARHMLVFSWLFDKGYITPSPFTNDPDRYTVFNITDLGKKWLRDN